MPLAKSVVQFAFSGGLDQGTQTEVLEPGAWLQAENVVRNKRGSFGTRPGNVALSKTILGQGVNLQAGVRLIAHGDELALIDGHGIYAMTAAGPSQVDQVPEPSISRHSVVQGGPNLFSADVAFAGGYAAVTYWLVPASGTAFVYVAVFDASTWAQVSAPKLIGSPTVYDFPQVVAVGAKLVWLAGRAGNKIDASVFDTGAPDLGWSAVTTIATDVAGGFDACGLSDRFAIVYASTARIFDIISIKTFSAASPPVQLASRTSGTSTTVTPGPALAIGGSSTDTLWAAWTGAALGATTVMAVNPTSLAVTGAPNDFFSMSAAIAPESIGLVETTALHATVVVGNVSTSGATTNFILYAQDVRVASGVATAVGSQRRASFLTLDSRPFYEGGRVYVWARYCTPAGDTSQRMAYCLDVADSLNMRSVATPAPRLIQNLDGEPSSGPICHVPVMSTGVRAFPISVLRTLQNQALEVVRIDFTDPGRFQPAPTLDTAALSAGCTSAYDGRSVAELGFLADPEIVLVQDAAVGLVVGTVSYVAVFEWYDAHGNVDRSAPSAPSAPHVVGGGGHIVTVEVRTLVVTAKTDPTNPVQVVLYRTSNGGTTWYRCASAPNDTTFQLVTFQDNLADADLISKEILYSPPPAVVPGGALPRTAPPGLSAMVLHRQRLAGIADDGQTVWVSGQLVSGERPWWNPAFQIPIAGLGRFVALASLDGRLYALGPDSIVVIDGDGPADNGSGYDYQITEVPTDVGCTDSRGLVVTKDGIVFRSQVGIHRLTRGLELELISEPVQTLLSTHPVVTSAVTHRYDAQEFVYFTCNYNDGATAGVTLVLEVDDGTWSTFYWTDPDTGNGTTPAVSAVEVGGTYYWLTAEGRTYQEAPGTFLDAGAFITVTVETPNIKLAGLQGFQRVWSCSLLANRLTDHDLRLSFSFDFAGHPLHVVTWTAAQIAALDREQIREILMQQDCQAVRAKIEVLPPSSGTVGSGAAVELVGLAFEVGTKSGFARRPPAATA